MERAALERPIVDGDRQQCVVGVRSMGGFGFAARSRLAQARGIEGAQTAGREGGQIDVTRRAFED